MAIWCVSSAVFAIDEEYRDGATAQKNTTYRPGPDPFEETRRLQPAMMELGATVCHRRPHFV